MKIKKGIQLIDQHDKYYMYGGKFGGNFIPETLKKPIDDLTILFSVFLFFSCPVIMKTTMKLLLMPFR